MKRLSVTTFTVSLSMLLCSVLIATAQPVTDAQGDVGIGTFAPDPSAKLDLTSTSKGFLLPRMTTVQRDAIVSPAVSLMIFNTTVGDFQYWDGNTLQWETVITTANANLFTWRTIGNNTLTAWNGVAGNFLGMQDNVDLVLKTENASMQFWTSNTERARFDAAGNFFPATDNTYSLGTNTNRWQDLYVNGGSAHIGPSGGDGVSELELGYAAGTGTLNVDGAGSEIDVTVGSTTVNNNLNAALNFDVTGISTLNGAVALGDAPADAISLNGTLTGLGSGHVLGTAGTDAAVLRIDGLPFTAPAFELDVQGDVNIAGLLALPGLAPNSVVYTNAGGALSTDNPPFAYNDVTNTMTTENIVVTASSDLQGPVANSGGNLNLNDDVDVTGILDAQSTIVNTTAATAVTVDDDLNVTGNADVDGNLNVDGTSTLVGVVDAQSAGNTVGDGTASRQLTVEGTADAVIGNTVAGNPTVWDQVVEGDFAATGLIKVGGSMWMDGATPGNHQVVANDALNVGTTNGNNLTLSTNATNAVVVDGATQDVNILNNVDVDGNGNVDGSFNVVGPATMQSTLVVSGVTTLQSNLNVDGPTDLNSTLNVDGAVTINNTIDQIGGGQITVSGNVDANNGLDVSGQDLNVDAGVSVEAPGAGHTFGTAATDAQVVEILGDPFNVGNYELFVDGDVQITGLLSLPALTANSIVVTDAAGNLITDNPPLGYDATTDIMTAPDIVPSADNTYALGTDATRWSEVYVNGASVHVGPSGGEAGGTELELGYAANTATVNVDGGPSEINVSPATTNITNDLDVDGNGNVDGTFNVVGPSTAQSTLEVDGITTLHSNLNVDGPTDLNSTLNVDGATTVNNTITQTGGGQVEFSGNVDANNGLDVTGADLTVDAGVSVEAPGAGHTFGTAATDAQVVEILGDPFNVGQYELVVDGDAQITGFLSLPGFATNAVVVTDALGNLVTDAEFLYDNTTNVVDVQGTIVNSVGNLTLDDAVDVTGILDAQAAANTIGDGSAVTQLTINGVQDATGAETIPDPAFDVAVVGDIGATGIIKSGASIIIDGVSNPRRVESDDILNINTTTGDINMNPAGGDVNVTGNANASNDVTAGNDFVLTSAAGTIMNSADPDVTVDDNLVVNGNISTFGPGTDVSAVNDVIAGSDVVAGGDVIMQSATSAITNTFAATPVRVDDDFDVIGNSTLNGDVDLGDAAGDAVTLNGTLTGAGANHSLGTAAVDANVLSILGDPFNVGNYELFVDGDVQITGLLSLPGLTPNAVVFVDAAGNFATEGTAGDFYWDETNNRLGIGNGGVAPTEALDVTGNIEATGTIQSGLSIVIDGTTPGAHNITATGGENLTITPTGGTLFSNAATFDHGTGLFTVTPGAVTYNGPQMVMPGILDVNPGSLNYLAGLLTVDPGTLQYGGGLLTVDPGTLQYGGGLLTVNPGTATYNGAQLLMPGILDVNPGSLDYLAGLLTVNPGTATYNGAQLVMPGIFDVNPGSLDYGAGAFNVDAAGNAQVSGNLNVDGDATLNGNVDLGDAAADAVTLNGTLTGAGSGHSLGTAAVDANVLTINGDPNNVGQYELDVQGDVNIAGVLTLPGVNPNSVLVTDAAGNIITDNEFAYDATTNVLDIQGTVVNSTGDVTVDDNLNVTGSADVDTDLNVDGNTVHVGTLDQQGAVSNSTGDVVINDDANVTGSLDVDTDLNVDGNTTHVGTLDQQGAVSNSTGDVVVNDDFNVTGSADVDTDLNVDGNTTLVGTLDAQSAGNTIGDGTAVTQLTINGVQDATGAETLPNAAFDLAVTGDIGATGIIKSGAGVWLDGVSATHSLTADEPLNVNTIGVNALTLSTNSTTAVTINGTTQNVNIANNLSVDGATTLGDGLDLTTINGPLTQAGAANQVTFGGNVDAQNGLDVAGGDLNVVNNANITGNLGVDGNATLGNNAADAVISNGVFTAINTANLNGTTNLGDAAADAVNLNGTLTGTGNGHSLGTLASDANVLTINGLANNAPAYELVVNGDVQVTGVLSFPGLTPNAVMFVDAAGNMATEATAGDFYWDETNNRLGIGNGGVAPTEALDVTGNIEATGTIQSGSSIIIDGTIPGNHNISTTGAEDLSINPGGGDLVVNGNTNVTGSLDVDTDLNVDGNTTHVGTLDQQGAVANSTGDVVINDDANVTGSLDVDTDLNVDGNTTHVGTLDQQGAVANSTGDVVINDDANVTGSLDVDTDLNVDGNTTHVGTLDQQGAISNSTGDVSVNDNLDVVNDLDVGAGNFTVAGATGNTDVGGTLDVTGAVTLDNYSGGGNQSLYVDNAGAVQASNATAAQNATGIFTGQVTVAAPNAGGTEAVANVNVVAGSVIVITRVSGAGGQLSHHISAVNAGVGFTIQFSAPVTAGDQINYMIVNP